MFYENKYLGVNQKLSNFNNFLKVNSAFDNKVLLREISLIINENGSCNFNKINKTVII